MLKVRMMRKMKIWNSVNFSMNQENMSTNILKRYGFSCFATCEINIERMQYL